MESSSRFANNQEKIRFIQVRHEESAAFMACAWAKFTGRIGACIATSGPGGIHLLNGLYDAKLDGQPVLAITGLQFHDLVGTLTQQDVALDKLFIDVCLLQRAGHGRGAHAERRGTRLPHGAGAQGRGPYHDAGGYAGAGGERRRALPAQSPEPCLERLCAGRPPAASGGSCRKPRRF